MQTILPQQGSTKPKAQSTPAPATKSRSQKTTLTPLQRYGRRPTLVISHRQSLPVWLKLLIGAKQGVALSLVLSVVAVLGVYTRMADDQRQWGQSYHQLRELERKERQLMGANELLKKHFAESAVQSNSDLVPIDPTKALFLKTSSERPRTWVDSEPVKIVAPPSSY